MVQTFAGFNEITGMVHLILRVGLVRPTFAAGSISISIPLMVTLGIAGGGFARKGRPNLPSSYSKAK